MATISNNLVAKSGINNYICNTCHYICYKKYNWDKHLLTSKHNKSTNINNLATEKWQKWQNDNKLCCEDCGKEYNDRSGLWRHKKKCNQSKETEKPIEDNNTTDLIDKDELIIQLLKQNAKLMELLENGTHNTNTTHNTNSHNKAFNLNFFLNETCKNAMNITDFVDSIKLQLSDLIDVGEIGYVEGISNIIVKNLNYLDENVRPIHCTDKKRETMYVKDQDKWEKDEEKIKLNTTVKKVANKNIRMLSQFREKYPEYNNSSSHISDTYNKTIIEATSYNDDKNKQIITNISKVTSIREKK
jgi:hypothetical protein